MKRLYVVVALVASMFFSVPALAEGPDLLGNFSSGFSDFVSPDEVERPISLRVDANESADTVDLGDISTVVDGWSTVPVDSRQVSIVPGSGNHFLRWMLTRTDASSQSIVVIAAVFVFFWWGLRKSVAMIVKAFKGRKLSV